MRGGYFRFGDIGGILDHEHLTLLFDSLRLCESVSNDLDVNERGRLSNITLRHKLKYRKSS
jgi:hypothetical protein